MSRFSTDNTWEEVTNLQSCSDLIAKFERQLDAIENRQADRIDEHRVVDDGTMEYLVHWAGFKYRFCLILFCFTSFQ